MTNQERDAIVLKWRKRAEDFLSLECRIDSSFADRSVFIDALRYHDIAAVYRICAEELERANK
jgi:ribosomal silencing factor RsfS